MIWETFCSNFIFMNRNNCCQKYPCTFQFWTKNCIPHHTLFGKIFPKSTPPSSVDPRRIQTLDFWLHKTPITTTSRRLQTPDSRRLQKILTPSPFLLLLSSNSLSRPPPSRFLIMLSLCYHITMLSCYHCMVTFYQFLHVTFFGNMLPPPPPATAPPPPIKFSPHFITFNNGNL